MHMEKERETALALARAVAARGGRAYYVGGCVRDTLLNRPVTDLDIEVHGVESAALFSLLSQFGEPASMGASFGIYGIKGIDLDIAMPRSEKATGRGHKDFEAFTDPFLGPEKAAMRRDFTVNALMQDILTGEILDFFGGRRDLEQGVLRHVNDLSFAEDPLRVFRAAQFAARFGFAVAPETVALCRGMSVDALPRERVMEELKKAFQKAPRPSVFFEVLREMDRLDPWFPEVADLIGVPQNPVFHPEGDVWNHTMRVLDEAALLRDGARYPEGFMFAALCHDFGKPLVTETGADGRIHSYNHEVEGLAPAGDFLRRLTGEVRLHRYVENMVKLHMRPNSLADSRSSVKAYMRLFDAAKEPEDLLLLSKADHLSCHPEPHYEETESTLRAMLALYRERCAAPAVTGADLLAAGVRPGPACKDALAHARKLQLAGIPKETALSQTLAFLRGRQ